jgi:hypothetical protein
MIPLYRDERIGTASSLAILHHQWLSLRFQRAVQDIEHVSCLCRRHGEAGRKQCPGQRNPLHANSSTP